MFNRLKCVLNKISFFYDINKIICNSKWRKINLNNFTNMGNIFDRNMVTVGKGTYGELNIKQFQKSNGKLKIGNYCSIAPNVTFLLDGEHDYNNISTYPFKDKFFGENETLTKGDIIVKDDVWIGYGATILSGVCIEQGAIVGANALVTKNVPPYAIVGGVPAKVLKYRFDNEKINILLNNLDYSKITDEQILKNKDVWSKSIKDFSADELLLSFKNII